MIKDSSYERVYTGSEINVNFLKNKLDEAGISSVIRNDQDSALRAGFGPLSDYGSQALLSVKKEDLVRAKYITEKTFSESNLTDTELEQQAKDSRLEDHTTELKAARPLISKEEKPKRSFFNIALNVGLLMYSLWRLYPLLEGQQLPTYRILLSSFIALFCTVTLVRHFTKTR
ncbi:putative signal transducing protein [Leeuwenhoekiella marinoflava]|uniref:Signal transducing protein n=2 Tax=Leeuwenhoekiella marinoflava TaxID=988 RepID=A0ABY1HWQ0_9FLAO|nr:DUF2007 domain-containing protein [Leeuwenhoekiella marinoflava]RXG28384.1 putative signal transducing protein [Leeuwenhoekiella marinoflava]SHF50507.1 Putative signal transducing protein [Leeuwenhoekiella marinoflava DSM 3653]